VGDPSPLTSRGKAAAMLAAQDAAVAAAEGLLPASGNAKAPLAADAAAAGATGNPAKPEVGTERTEPAAKELGKDASPGAKRAEGASGEVAAVAGTQAPREQETQARTEPDCGRCETRPHDYEQAEHHPEKCDVSDQTSTSSLPMPTPRPKRSSQEPSYLVKRRLEAKRRNI
jgi:hypothetical protein